MNSRKQGAVFTPEMTQLKKIDTQESGWILGDAWNRKDQRNIPKSVYSLPAVLLRVDHVCVELAEWE